MKNISEFISENFQLLVLKFSIYSPTCIGIRQNSLLKTGACLIEIRLRPDKNCFISTKGYSSGGLYGL